LFDLMGMRREGAAGSKAVAARAALYVLYGLAALFGLYSSLKLATSLFGADPDVVHSLLMWKGITQHGLGWLRDWRFTPDNWLLSSVPLNAVAYSLFGDSVNIPIFMGWAVFVASAATAGAIAARLGARRAVAPIVVVLLNLGWFAHRWGFVSYATSHNVTNLFGLLSLLCLLEWVTRRRMICLIGSVVLMTCGSLSDPWMVAAYDLPLGLGALALALHPAVRERRGELVAALSAVAISLVLYATQLFGVFSFVPKLGFSLGPLSLAKANAVVVEHDIGALIDAVPTAILRPGLAYAASFLAFLTLVGSLVWTDRRAWLKPEPGEAFVFAVAALSAGGTSAALTIMNQSATEISTRFLINIPFLLAPVIGVLAERGWNSMPRLQKAAVVVLPAAVAITGMIGGAGHLSPGGIAIPDLGVESEVAFLKAHGLSYGYGNYWGSNANVVALVTHDAIRVRPVTYTRTSGMMQTDTRPQASRRWFDPGDEPPGLKRWFVIAQPGPEECPDFQLCLSGLRHRFGEPVETLDFGQSKVLVWDHRLVGGRAPRIHLARGGRLAFGEAGTFPGTEGWSAPEPWGVWSDGPSAALRLQLDGPVQGDLKLEMQGHAFLSPKGRQIVRVSLNGRPLGALTFDDKANEGVHTLAAPAGLVPADGRMDLEFEIEQPTAPGEVSRSPDPRRLGLGLEALTIR
jgi:hypothetical protein